MFICGAGNFKGHSPDNQRRAIQEPRPFFLLLLQRNAHNHKRKASMRLAISALCLALFLSVLAAGQTLSRRPADSPSPSLTARPQASPSEIPLIVPAGTPLKIAIDWEVRIRALGQPVHGKVIEPSYTQAQWPRK